MNILDLLKEDKIEFKRVASTNGGEYKSSCPVCKGKDRFCIWPHESKGGRFWCRMCSISGGTINYLMIVRKMKHEEACAYLGIPSQRFKRQDSLKELRSGKIYQPKYQQYSSQKPISVQWKNEATKFFEWSIDQLWSFNGNKARQWLLKRGLQEKTIKEAKLGFNPQELWLNRNDWGLSEELNDKGKLKALWLPKGIVIPCFRDNQFNRLKFRTNNENMKYYIVPGSSNIPMVLGDNKSIMIVESELDALLVFQEAGDLVSVVSLGSASNKPDVELAERLKRSKHLFISLDSDEAGAKNSLKGWIQHFSHAKRIPIVRGKDPSEAYQKGLNIRIWVESAFMVKKRQKLINVSVNNSDKSAKCTLVTDKTSLEDAILSIKDNTEVAISITDDGSGQNPNTIQLAVKGKKVININMSKLSGNGIESLKGFLNTDKIKVFHNAKSQLKLLFNIGISVKPPFFDTMIAAQLLEGV